jgi:hypothetical protein
MSSHISKFIKNSSAVRKSTKKRSQILKNCLIAGYEKLSKSIKNKDWQAENNDDSQKKKKKKMQRIMTMDLFQVN